MARDVVLPDDVDLGNYGLPFDSVDGLAAYLANADNDASAYCGVRSTVERWHSGALPIASYRWRALGVTLKKVFPALIDWQWVRRRYGFDGEGLFVHELFVAIAELQHPKPPQVKPPTDADPSIGNIGWQGGNDGRGGYDDDCYYGTVGWRG